jgi:hypothetical protein
MSDIKSMKEERFNLAMVSVHGRLAPLYFAVI